MDRNDNNVHEGIQYENDIEQMPYLNWFFLKMVVTLIWNIEYNICC